MALTHCEYAPKPLCGDCRRHCEARSGEAIQPSCFWMASLRHVRLPNASAARVLPGIQALCRAVFRTGNILIPRDYFLPAAPPQVLHFKTLLIADVCSLLSRLEWRR
jgi:hypothetical protein